MISKQTDGNEGYKLCERKNTKKHEKTRKNTKKHEKTDSRHDAVGGHETWNVADIHVGHCNEIWVVV